MSPPDLIPLNRSEHLYWAGEGHLGPINQPYVLRLSGAVDEALVRQALRELTTAFPRLRAVIEPGPWLDRLRILPHTRAAALARLVAHASTVDGIVKGLRHPQWPQDGWEALRRLALELAQTAQGNAPVASRR